MGKEVGDERGEAITVSAFAASGAAGVHPNPCGLIAIRRGFLARAFEAANVLNEAVVETGTVHCVSERHGGSAVGAVAGDATNRFGAQSASGAGGGSIGVAGSVSINVANVDAAAAIRSGGAVDATGGDVSLSAVSTSVSAARALGGTFGGSSYGLGVSFGLSKLKVGEERERLMAERG